MLHRRLEASRAFSPCFEALETRQLLAAVTVSTASELLNAVNNGADGDVITLNAGTYELTETLNLRDDMTLRGAGVDQTILTPVSTWQPGTAGLPDSASSTTNNFNNSAYLLSLVSDHNVVIEDLTLDGNYQVHGGIVAEWSNNFILRDSKLEEFAWSGVRTYKGGNHLYTNNEFINAASKVGATGGMIHSRYLQNSLIDNNTFLETSSHPNETYGIKAEGMSGTRITNNTIQTDGFSIEIAHEHEHSIEIDHNYLSKAVSVPKQGNDNVAGDYSFYIHHNYFKNSYSLEWNRNDIEVAWNLFDFDVNQDGGHLITNFDNGSNASASGTKFHNNLIKNPGRGLFDAPFGHAYNDFNFYNNHVIGNTTATPRTGGLFGFPTATDESTMTIKDNIFEFNGQSRPLFKNSASYAVNVENNTLTNISDTGNYSNTSTSAVRGTTAPLLFNVGQDGEYLVDGWDISEVNASLSIAINGTPTDLGTATSYSDQDVNGSIAITAGGDGAQLTGNAWKKLALPSSYTVTADTVLEVTVTAPDAGEILGIGLDDDNEHRGTNQTIQLGGSQTAGSDFVQTYNTYTSGSQTYVIPVGQYYSPGTIDYLTLIADDDANASADVTFADIKLYEDAPSASNGTPIDFATASISGYESNQDGANGHSSAATVTNGGTGLQLTGNAWKDVTLSATLSSNSVLAFDVDASDAGEILAIGLDSDNDHKNQVRMFQVSGSDPSSNMNQDFMTYTAGSGVRHYEIPIGSYYTGAMNRLVLIADDDANGSSNATFSNVAVYDAYDFSSGVSGYDASGTGDGQGGDLTQAAVLDGGRTLKLSGNAWKKFDVGTTVSANTWIEFDFKSDSPAGQGEIQGLGFATSGDTVPDDVKPDTLQLWGTQAWGNQSVVTYFGSGWTHIKVKATDFAAAGSYASLIFINDDDAGNGTNPDSYANSYFRNLRVYNT